MELVLSGPPADPAGPGVGLMRHLGATVHQLATADRAAREAEVERVAAEVRGRGGRPYVIGVGGSGVLGAYGQYLAGLEAFDQAGGRPAIRFDVHRPPVGDGRDAGRAGRRVRPPLPDDARRGHGRGPTGGRAAAGDRRRLVRRPPRRRSAARTRPTPRGSHRPRRTPARRGLRPPDPAAAEAAELLARSEGILVDPIYTAKALAGLIAARPRRRLGRRSASCSGTPAACPGSSSRSTDALAAADQDPSIHREVMLWPIDNAETLPNRR